MLGIGTSGFLFIIVLLGAGTGVLSLQCYTCVALDCGGNEHCEFIKSQILSLASYLYYTPRAVSSCPSSTAPDEEWHPLTQRCEEKRQGDATCALGRLKINVLERSSGDELTYYATITGCATQELLRRIKEATGHSTCDFHTKIAEDQDRSIKMYMEHCGRIENLCYQYNNCIPQASIDVKVWGDGLQDEQSSKRHLFFIGGMALMTIIYIGLVIYGIRTR